MARQGYNADDGDTHGFLTDLRVGVHYQLLEDPVALAPFIAYVVPTNNNYYVQGHAAQGRGLEELLVGFGLGKSFDKWIPRTYAQMKYTYGFVEKVADISHDRANLSLETRRIRDAALEPGRLRLVAMDVWGHRNAGSIVRPPVSVSRPPGER